VMDFGSGVTFFPFELAAEGFDVKAVDIDPIVERDFKKAVEVTPRHSGKVTFKLASPDAIPLEDASVDAVYSISVLEHVADPVATVAEMGRVLAPGGLLILTIDICQQGDGEMRPASYRRLKRYLEQNFSWNVPERLAQPARVLDSQNSPYPYPHDDSKGAFDRLVRSMKQLVKAVCFGRPLREPPPIWACMGIALNKRRD